MNLYGFVDNDAINSWDYLGLFDSVPWGNVHGGITSEALSGSFSDMHVMRLTEGSNAIDFPDFLKYKNNAPYNLQNHFDGIRTPDQLQANWGAVNQRMASLAQQIAASYCANTFRANVDGLLNTYGGIIHSVQDFYAHSNMAEKFPGQLYDPSNSDQQTVTTGMTLNLPLYKRKEWHGGHSPTDPGMNHDAPGRPNFDLARSMAVQATQQNWQQMQQLISQQHDQLKAAGKCCPELEELIKWFTGR